MMSVLFVSNIPVPYRVEFYNELGKYVDVTVIFEAKGASDQGIKFNYNLNSIKNFKAIFLSEGDIKENRVDWSIFRIYNKRFDKIVLTCYSYLTEMIFLLYLKQKKIKYYLSSDGGVIKSGEPVWKRKLKKYLISGAEGYFSPSTMTDQYLEYYGANSDLIHRYPFTSYKKEQQIKTPVDEREKCRIKKELGIAERYLVLGVGQFIHRKGWDILLKSMSRMKDDVSLCIIGGSVTEEYNNLVEEYGLKHVTFKDFMSNEQLSQYYMAADVFVLPTREDIWGLVINEAMNYGLPVITTDKCIAGLELIHHGENGFILNDVDSDDSPNRLYSYIDAILRNEKTRNAFSMKALEIISGYSIESMAKAYVKVLTEE